MEVEAADLCEWRGKRVHRVRKLFRKRKLCVGPDFVLKHVMWDQSFGEVGRYISINGEPNGDISDDESCVPVKDLEIDPFSMRSFHLPYSLNKRKRWTMEGLMADHIEEFQTESLRVSGLTQVCSVLHADLEEYHVTNPLEVMDSTVTTEYHTADGGEAVHEYGRNKHAHEYLKKPNPPKRRRRGKPNQVVNPYNFAPFQSENGIDPHDRKVHLAYVIVKSDLNKSRLNADSRVSKAPREDKEEAMWKAFFKAWGLGDDKDLEEITKSKPTRAKCKNNYLRKTKNECREYFDESWDSECSESDYSEASLPEPPRLQSPVLLNECIVTRTHHSSRRKRLKKRVLEDYRTFKPELEEQDENSTAMEENTAKSAELKLEDFMLEKTAEYTPETSFKIATSPPMFSTTNASGDLVVIRQDGFVLYPVPPEKSEDYLMKSVEKVKNIFCEMASIASESTGDHLEVLHPYQAEKLALQLWIEENSPAKSIECAQNLPTECEICFNEGFLFSIASCGHYSCVDCWTHYSAQAIHDNRVPLRCIGFKCMELLPLPVLKCFLRQESVRRYEKQLANRRLLQKDFFPCHRCDHFLFSTSITSRILICACGAAICRECREEAHVPLSCGNMKKYEDMLQRNGQSFHDSALAHVASGVKCPRCQGLVDRTAGCNHMVCFCGHEFCFACGGPFTGSHYECDLEAPRDHALIDGAETVHPTVFQKCFTIRRKKSRTVLNSMRTVLLRKRNVADASSLIQRYSQILDFFELSYVHLYVSYRRVHFKPEHFPAKQFTRLAERLLFVLKPFDNIDRLNSERLEAALDSAISICDTMSSVCIRMPLSE